MEVRKELRRKDGGVVIHHRPSRWLKWWSWAMRQAFGGDVTGWPQLE